VTETAFAVSILLVKARDETLCEEGARLRWALEGSKLELADRIGHDERLAQPLRVCPPDGGGTR